MELLWFESEESRNTSSLSCMLRNSHNYLYDKKYDSISNNTELALAINSTEMRDGVILSQKVGGDSRACGYKSFLARRNIATNSHG